MNEAGVAPPGLKPIQKPMNDAADERPRVAGQDLPGLPAPPAGSSGPGRPGSASPSSTVRRISPIPKSPMHRHDEVEALHEVGEAEGQAQLRR